MYVYIYICIYIYVYIYISRLWLVTSQIMIPEAPEIQEMSQHFHQHLVVAGEINSTTWAHHIHTQ